MNSERGKSQMPEEEKAIECPETEPVETADEASAPEEQDDPARTEGEVAEETEETEETEEQPCVRPEKKKRKKRLKFYEITPENDIRYRGPLSYRYLRIAAWLLFILAQIECVITLISKVDATVALPVPFGTIFETCGNMMMPLFLIATFAIILNGSRSFKHLLLLYGGAAIVFGFAFLIVHERYLTGSITALFGLEPEEAGKILDKFLMNLAGGRFLSFNIFVDLFLCTLLAFFLMYRPKKVFVGKWHYLFRSFAILPIFYEVVSFFLKILAAAGFVTLPVFVLPLLTTKPPMTFIVFLILTFFLKSRERIYRKKGGTHEQYQEFLKTNANSWRFSSFTAGLLVIAGFIDLVIQLFMTIFLTGALAGDAATVEENSKLFVESFLSALNVMRQCGIGASGYLILVAPIILLFSYTRVHKDKRADIIIPGVAVGLLAVIYLEGLYRFIVAAGERLEAFLTSFQ